MKSRYRVLSSVVGLLAFLANVATDAGTQIEKGNYLARAGNCYSCHSRPGGKPFAGGRAFKTTFGLIYSSNITPDIETGIGSWSEDDFVRAMHEGISPDGDRLYPVFPYPSYTKLNIEDVRAIYDYVKDIEPANYTAPENELDFPYSQRWLMSIWNKLYFDEGRYQYNAALSGEANRGAYLVLGLGHCGSCHTPRNFLGAPQTDKALSGGSYLDIVEHTKLRQWSSVNLTPGPGGLKNWSSDDIAAYLKQGYNKHTATFGPMNEVIENSTQYLSDADLTAIGMYLKTLPPVGEIPADHKIDEETMRQGQIMYDIHCGTCHLPTGLGSEDTGTPMAGSTVVLAADPSSLINSILYGANAPPSLLVPEGWSTMKAFGNRLDDEEVAILSTFLRNSWGNRASPVTPEQVEQQR